MLIAQISDTHIVAKGKDWETEPLTEVDKRLAKVVKTLNTLNPLPNVVLLTGDATDEGDAPAYEYLRELLSPLKIPLYIIPGNHDQRETMRAAFADHSYLPKEGLLHYVIDDYPVRLIGLDTLIEGHPHGELSDPQIAWLEGVLEENPQKPSLIFMHHPPAKIGLKLFDAITCFVSPRFSQLLQKHASILGIVVGHYHHLCISTFAGKPCLMAPSVAPVHYFAHPDDEDVTALELEDPAITLHSWETGGVLVSHVKRVKEDYRRLDWKSIQQRQLSLPALLN